MRHLFQLVGLKRYASLRSGTELQLLTQSRSPEWAPGMNGGEPNHPLEIRDCMAVIVAWRPSVESSQPLPYGSNRKRVDGCLSECDLGHVADIRSG